MRFSWMTVTVGGVAATFFLYAVTCIYERAKRQEAFNSVSIGDSIDSVVMRFGDPSVRESPDKLFARYASTKCQPPCAERLWFENRLAFDLEAWSVSIGGDGTVVEKYHWVSP
jgi:hypothetical protein